MLFTKSKDEKQDLINDDLLLDIFLQSNNYNWFTNQTDLQATDILSST